MIIPSFAALRDVGLTEESEVRVAIIDFKVEDKAQKKSVSWEVKESLLVPRNFLAYNSTSDQSNNSSRSWEKFAKETSRSSGSCPMQPEFAANITKAEKTNVPGILHAARFMIIAPLFRTWLLQFSDVDRRHLARRASELRSVIVIKDKEKFSFNDKGIKKDNSVGKFEWYLPVIALTKDGKRIVIGLNPELHESAIPSEIANVIAFDISSRFAKELRYPKPPGGVEKLEDSLQGLEGVGRNVFGMPSDSEELKKDPSEKARHYGVIHEVNRAYFKKQYANKAAYNGVKIGSNPDNSELWFFPNHLAEWSEIKSEVTAEVEKRRQYFEQKKADKKGRSNLPSYQQEKSESLKLAAPVLLPKPFSARVLLVNRDVGRQEKWVILRTFSKIPMRYWRALEEILRRRGLQTLLLDFGKKVKASRSGESPPSSYIFWTDIYTKALDAEAINVRLLWRHLPLLFGSASSEDLVSHAHRGGGDGRLYFRILEHLRVLQRLIKLESAQALTQNNFAELFSEESPQPNGAYWLMEDESPRDLSHEVEDLETYCEAVWPFVSETTKDSLKCIARMALDGVPNQEWPLFVRGALSGLLLSRLSWALGEENRSFHPTQGRHPCTLRGESLVKPFNQGIGLGENLPSFKKRFNPSVLAWMHGRQKESEKSAFNNGLIVGLSFIPQSKKENSESKRRENSES